MFLVDINYVSAKADMHQENLQGVQASGLHGYRLSNGDFIFSWRDTDYKKMVLTTNNGTKLAGGYMSWNIVKGGNWADTSLWTLNGDYYTLSNFKGSNVKGKGYSDI